LDLTVIGPLPHEPADGFVSWVNRIRAGRPTEAAAIEASVRQGVEFSRAGGVVAVGDICGAVNGSASTMAAEALRDAGMAGVSFIEFFAIGPTERERADAAVALIREHHASFGERLRLGLQPHATNTVSRWAFERAIEAAGAMRLPTMTHLAESPEERDFVANAAGPQRELLEGLGLWTDAVAAEFGQGRSPIEQLERVLAGSGTVAVHVNQCSHADLERLAASDTPVVYCPRASAYFGAEAHFGPHRYRDMIAAGLTVAIGTDSIVNLPAGSSCLSPLDEIRFLHRRDATDPMTLVTMASLCGGRVLGLDESSVCLAPDACPLGVVAVPVGDAEVPNPATAIVLSEGAPRIVLD
ncbi:MAG: amidohydrolase family protein, partial [Planctomycetota bacterium]